MFPLSCLAWHPNVLAYWNCALCWMLGYLWWQNSRIADHPADSKCGQRRDNNNWERASKRPSRARYLLLIDVILISGGWGKSNNNAEAYLTSEKGPLTIIILMISDVLCHNSLGIPVPWNYTGETLFFLWRYTPTTTTTTRNKFLSLSVCFDKL